MRSTKELFELMLEHKDMFADGLCSLAFDMFCIRSITKAEYERLTNYISSKRPKVTYNRYYYWPPRVIEPRIKWLNKHIKLLSRVQTT